MKPSVRKGASTSREATPWQSVYGQAGDYLRVGKERLWATNPFPFIVESQVRRLGRSVIAA
jgi:hypothetical protein